MINSLAISASLDWDMTKYIAAAIRLLDGNIKGYKIDKMDKSGAPVLLFMSYGDDAKEYPFPINADNAEVLAAHIRNYISQLTDEDLKAFHCEPTGYEEDYEIGFEIFTPDWYSDEYGIDDYDESVLLAVKPKFIEYGK